MVSVSNGKTWAIGKALVTEAKLANKTKAVNKAESVFISFDGSFGLARVITKYKFGV